MPSSACWDFWSTCFRMARRPRTVIDTLSLPLAAAVRRCRWATAWSVTLLALATWLADPGWPTTTVRHLLSAPWVGPDIANLAYVTAALLTMPTGYGIVRLYTLIHHTLAVNVFHTAGLRLKLLNLETTLLSLSFPYAVCEVLGKWMPWIGSLGFIVVSAFAVWLVGVGYDMIFVRRQRRRLGLTGGILLWMGATALTLFVLVVGAATVLVALSVVGFFVVLVARTQRLS
ncbi:MAG: DUF3040 domain-containing protein [Alicyclobacillus macrosporangiidus]|uniref:hypothetical protein n=1 Tax=Alicyclobacillus macrosporangiidus TaxID=392015 RepID=UPI0026F29B9A|nr:hypothetical protein [Alicyclobacillus macrosporangiidus]MCL6597883.1 DUF3040 domain-containing protein [Alicyclobacillus macrosporangiidus]